MSTLIENVRVVRPGKSIESGSLLIDGGKIQQINPASAAPGGAARVDGKGRLITPGLIDLHTHGIGNYLYERSADDLMQCATALPKFGTTCVLPTLYRVMNRQSLKLLSELSDAMTRVTDACFPGFHLEGPFLALPGAGAETLPGDVGLLNDVLEACRGRVLAMSISPDTPCILPVIEILVERKIVPFITHTRATAEQAQIAIDAGAVHATHFYDVFPVPPETEPGARPVGCVEAIYANSNVTVDFICDGVHVHPMAVRAAATCKGFQNVVLITDSNIGAGNPPGIYDTPWGFRVQIRPGDAARHETKGFLAGSAMTMDVGMANLHRWLGDRLLPEQIWAMGSTNPARVVGLKSKGKIEAGADADLVLWNEDFTAAVTWVGGRIVYQA